MARVPYPPSRFARAQSVCDLRALLGSAGAESLSRLAGLLPGVSLDALADAARAGRLPADDPALAEAVGLAATLPGEDAEAFRLATALLLADALRQGGPAAALGWYYEAHADAYRAAPAPVRAALFNGFRVLGAAGRAAPEPPPSLSDRATRTRAAVEAGLAGAPPQLRAPLTAALAGGPPQETEALWRARGRDLVAAPAVADAVRHLYETRDDWDPYRDWSEARIAEEGVAIPFEAP